MTKEEVDFIGRMNMCDEISNEAYKKIMCHCEEQNPCEDAISREDVIKAVDHHTFDTDDGLCLDEDISIILEELPPVTPTRKKGKWTNGDPICPCCGEDKFKDLDADIWADWQPKYCPNCGLEMEGEE